MKAQRPSAEVVYDRFHVVNEGNLEPEQVVKLEALLAANAPLATVYLLKTLWFADDEKTARRRWHEWGGMAMGSGLLSGVAFTAIWHLLGWIGLPAMAPWALGYLYFTACLIWMVGRCWVGITHLTNNRPVANPRSLAFGGARVTLVDR